MAKVGRLLKETMIAELSQKIGERPDVFVAQVNRLTAADSVALRKKLHAAQARFVMVKRRIGLRVLDQLKMVELKEMMEGSVGLVLTSDDVSPVAKELVEFIKSHENQLTVRGASIGGQVVNAEWVEALAKLPARPVLLAQLMATIELPLASLISTAEQVISDLAWAIEQVGAAKPAGATSGDKAPGESKTEPPQDAAGTEAAEGQPPPKPLPDAKADSQQIQSGDGASQEPDKQDTDETKREDTTS